MYDGHVAIGQSKYGPKMLPVVPKQIVNESHLELRAQKYAACVSRRRRRGVSCCMRCAAPVDGFHWGREA